MLHIVNSPNKRIKYEQSNKGVRISLECTTSNNK